ncbi:MAG: hypothetical protein DRJ47_00925 [Thermoprotei archaeon]|nr:MAG: hypothetical protein DRJ47_00925 [Thermoprotei archaeon]
MVFRMKSYSFTAKTMLLFFVVVTLIHTGMVQATPLDVPYVHQVYDMPDWFDGRYSCGATSVVMVLAYYGVLPEWPINSSNPYQHTSIYGAYVCGIFKVGDYTFDQKALDASRTRYGRGVHGYVYIPGSGASWSKMAEVFRIFGFEAYVDTTPTWEELVEELDKGHPVIISTQLTSSGHIVVAVGYMPNRSVIVNDPAGDLNRGKYFNYYGKGVVYDWPGVDNGHVNLNKVKAFIIVHPTSNIKQAQPVKLVQEDVTTTTSRWTTIMFIVVVVAVMGLMVFSLAREKNRI